MTEVWILIFFIQGFYGIPAGTPSPLNWEGSPVQVGRYSSQAECLKIRKEIVAGMKGTWKIHGPRPDKLSECVRIELHD